jgi:hypothetical protein
MEKVEITATVRKGCSPKEIHEDFMDTVWKKSPIYSTVKNLRGTGRALENMSGQKKATN